MKWSLRKRGKIVMLEFEKSNQGVKMIIRIGKTFSSMSIKCNCQKTCVVKRS
jgi:hypothetical protein